MRSSVANLAGLGSYFLLLTEINLYDSYPSIVSGENGRLLTFRLYLLTVNDGRPSTQIKPTSPNFPKKINVDALLTLKIRLLTPARRSVDASLRD
ncbi:MAG: hypothetical protein GY796_31160 [Chloroflexi bacterium]|nr:hypothetical protein [Chloroflexota bacterium]